MRTLYILTAFFAGLFLAAIGGSAGCPPKPTPAEITPEQIVANMQAGADYTIAGIGLVEQVVTSYEAPQFFACVAADTGKAGLEQFKGAAPSIVPFVEAGGGTMHVDAYGPIMFDRCDGMEGKTDPWPMVNVPDSTRLLIEGGVQLAVGMLVDWIETQLPGPETGNAYYAARVGLSLLEQFGDGGFQFVFDGLCGAPSVTLPAYDLAWTPKDEAAPEGLAGAPTDLAPAGMPAKALIRDCPGDARAQAQCKLSRYQNAIELTAPRPTEATDGATP